MTRLATRLLPVLLVIVPLASCASPSGDELAPPLASGPATRYDCDGLPVAARYGPAFVNLEIGGRTESLPKVAAASGAKYESGIDASYRLFWTKGDTARVALGDDRWLACTEVPDTPTVESFEAQGNEPPWTLAMLDGSVVLERGYEGEGTIATLRESVEGDDGSVRHAADAGGRELIVDVVPGPCTDDMSGMTYPATVTVELDGEMSRGCGGEPASLPVGGEWTVERIGDVAVLADAPATIVFTDEGRAAGSTGCNRWSGEWTLTGESLTLGRIASTRRACRGPVGEQEVRLLRALEAVRGFKVEQGGALVLTGPRGDELVARRAEPAPD